MALAALQTEFGSLIEFVGGGNWEPSKHLENVVRGIASFTSEEDAKEVIMEVIQLFMRETASSAPNQDLLKGSRNMIVHFFTMFSNKKSMKRFLIAAVHQYAVVNRITEKVAQELYEEILENKKCNLEQSLQFFNFIATVQTADEYNFEINSLHLFPLCLALYDAYTHHTLHSFQYTVQEKIRLNELMDIVIQELLTMYVREIRSAAQFKLQYSRQIFIYSYIIVFNDQISFEMRNKAGLLFVQAYSAVNMDTMSLPPLRQQQQERDSPAIQIPKAAKEKFYNLFNALQGIYRDNEYVIIIYSSIMNVVPDHILLSETVKGKTLICTLYEGIMRIAMKPTIHHQIIVEASRILVSVGRHMQDIPSNMIEPMFEQGMDYVSSHIDHYIDNVRLYSRYFLDLLLDCAIHLLHVKQEQSVTDILVRRMNEMPRGSTLLFLCYDGFSKRYGVHALLAQFDEMIDILLGCISDPTMAVTSCKTYTSIMERAFPNTSEQRIVWSKTWVLPVLKLLKTKNDKEVQNYCQKIFCSAFKLQPTMLRVVFPRDYLGSTQESACLLTCLNQVRKGNLEIQHPRNESNLYWRGLVDRKRMDTYMIHQDEDIRILVLACIVDTQRTTESFNDWEFVFLITYIRYNISCEIPKIRKQMVEYYKKAIKRYEAGLKVIIRNISELVSIVTRLDEICKQYQESLKQICTTIEELHEALEPNDEEVKTGKAALETPSPEDPEQIRRQIEELNQQYDTYCQQYQLHLDQLKEHNTKLNPMNEVSISYKRFISSFTKIMIGNLSYDSNYPRRAVSLELLLAIRNILKTEEWQTYWTEEDIKNSHNVLFDSYESNKKLMVELLRSLPPTYLGFTNIEFTYKYLYRSVDMSMEVRPSKTLAAAYLLEVCTMSPYFGAIAMREDPFPHGNEDTDPKMGLIAISAGRLVEEAKDLNLLDLRHGVYGLALAVRLQLESRDLTKYNHRFPVIFDCLSEAVVQIANIVMPVVCDPSPEGYLPDSIDTPSNITEEFSRAQRLLVYAWRTIKEIMLLLSEMVRQAVLFEHQYVLLADERYEMIGDFFMRIFYESKHRGVFEQAHVAFTVICDSFVASRNGFINNLPKTWLLEATKIVAGRANRGISSTRRSAGLPFLILSTLCAEMKRDVACFPTTMQLLFKGAENPGTTPRVNEYKIHSMNVLRAIFRHSKLGEHVAPFVGQGVAASIRGFNTENWGVRNSSTLLFAALITRIFGVQRTSDSEELSIKNRLTVRVFITRYPELHEFLLKTLEEECTKHNSLVLAPVLMILSRLYPSHSEEYNDQIENYLPFVHRCLSNPVHQTRELAAKASVALIDEDSIPARLAFCFDLINKPDVGDTECHGILLQVWYLLKSFKERNDLSFDVYVKSGLTIIENIGKKFSHMTANLYIEIVAHILYTHKEFRDMSTLKDLLTLLQNDTDRNINTFTCQSKYLQNKVILSTYVFINKFAETDMTLPTVTNQILHYLVADDDNMKRFSLNLLIALNHKLRLTSKSEQKVHPLIEMGEVEIPPEVDGLVSTLSTNTVKKILTACHAGLKNFIRTEVTVMRYTSHHDRMLFFVLASYYPCSIRFLTPSKQRTLRALLRFCDTSSEEVISAAIIFISSFVSDCDLSLLEYRQLVKVLERSASPKADVCRRVAVCEFMNRNVLLYCNQHRYLKELELKTMLNIMVVLLEDDELMVRNKMANFENNAKVRMVLNTPSDHIMPVVPEKARDDAIVLMTILLPPREAINLLISWGCRYFPDPSISGQDVFERGELNLYAENTPLIDVCVRMLMKTLWMQSDGLSYEDRSILIEEKTLLVTTAILDALNTTYTTRIILSSTRVALINIMKGMYKFLELAPISDNFNKYFTKYFAVKALDYITNHLDHCDMFCVKKLIRKLYDPVYQFAPNSNGKKSPCT